MYMNQFAWALSAKGYTLSDISKILKDRGLPSSDSTISAAVRSKDRTARQKRLYAAMTEILDSLPVKPGTEDDFVRKTRECGVTVYAVWEYYNATRNQKYALTPFRKAVSLPSSPFEHRLREEALKCLYEMTDHERAGRSAGVT